MVTTTPSFVGFPLGVRNGTFSATYDTTSASSCRSAFLSSAAIGGSTAVAEQALIDGLTNGTAYVNIHSTTFPGGEIRSFPQVPEPGTMALMGTALADLLRRRRRE